MRWPSKVRAEYRKSRTASGVTTRCHTQAAGAARAEGARLPGAGALRLTMSWNSRIASGPPGLPTTVGQLVGWQSPVENAIRLVLRLRCRASSPDSAPRIPPGSGSPATSVAGLRCNRAACVDLRVQQTGILLGAMQLQGSAR